MLGLSWPEVHGALTHFPVALLITAAVFEVGATVLHKPTGRLVSFWLLFAAVVMAIPTLVSGWVTGSQLFTGSSRLPDVFVLHRMFAFGTSGLAIILLLWRIKARDQLTGSAAIASLLLLLLAAGAAGCTGYLGGRMVFGSTDQSRSSASSTPAPYDGKERETHELAANRAEISPQAITAGQKLFQNQKCLSCHKLNGAGGTLGPDLTHEGSHQSDIEWHISHLKNPEKMTPGTAMPAYSQLKPEELKALASFLATRR